jgi:hypothetical protein
VFEFIGDPSSNITSEIKGLDWQTNLSAPIEVKSVSAALANQVQTLSEAGRALHDIINASSDVHHLDEAARRLWKGNGEGWISDSEGGDVPFLLHRSRASLRLSQCFSFRDGSNTRSTCRFSALMTLIRANIVGPPSVATRIRASIAACHSAASCSALGSFVTCLPAFSRLTRGRPRGSVPQIILMPDLAMPRVRANGLVGPAVFPLP